MTLRQPLNGYSGQWWSKTAILTLGKTVKLQAIRKPCNKLLTIMLNCWRVNESWTVDITELLIQKLSAVFATKNLLELGAMNVIIWICNLTNKQPMEHSSPNAHAIRNSNIKINTSIAGNVTKYRLITYIRRSLLTKRFSRCLILPKKNSVVDLVDWNRTPADSTWQFQYYLY